MLPDPEALYPVAPPDPTAVQVSDLMSGLSDSASVTAAPTAVVGPELAATIVYFIDVPGMTVPTAEEIEDPPWSSTFVMLRSPLGVNPISVTGVGLRVTLI